MTVIKNYQKISFPSNSENNSDSESLRLGSASASDTESLNNTPISRPFVGPIVKPYHFEEQKSLKKCPGKKKLRRYQNRCFLQTLAEEEEDVSSTYTVMDSYETPFTKLLQDDSALEYWNVFIEKSEKEQAEVIEAFTHSNSHKNEAKLEKPQGRISSRIKRTIRVKKDLSLEEVKQSEDDLIGFFKASPKAIYEKFPSTYFQRLLLHAIAQYHGLKSTGVLKNGMKSVEVFNSMESWSPAECFLTDFVAQLR